MKIYRYYGKWEYFKEVIEENKLYFGDVKEYNDPYEEQATFKDKDGITYSLENVKDKAKICSFSRSCTNYLLWSHYAEKHTGYCIGFDFKKIVLKDFEYHYSKLINQDMVFGNVRYGVKIKEFDKVPKGLNNDEFLDYYYQKYDCWAYEEEVRALIKSEISKKITIPRTYIKEVILGIKCKNGNEVVKLLKGNNYKIPIKKTDISCLNTTLLVNVYE